MTTTTACSTTGRREWAATHCLFDGPVGPRARGVPLVEVREERALEQHAGAHLVLPDGEVEVVGDFDAIGRAAAVDAGAAAGKRVLHDDRWRTGERKRLA